MYSFLLFQIKIIKERLNIDGKQFHQYQQNEQSPPFLTHRWLNELGRWI